ncbi:acyltransferase family protein [Corynebacterium frankenforstense]|uniref:acyltransferase family protein n=1 Tax=Corynebacterium frankenforstense TaxID=1230998 RepID=UPI000A6CFDBF|nr:acyltransferase family protein [Corynebacterium frankenforstense]
MIHASRPATGPSAVAPERKKVRLAWPDVAKGLSIIGVVVLHVCLEVPNGMETALAGVNHVLDPLRMCLFFLVSGLFSAKVMRMSFSELFCRRLWFFIVPYVLWTPVEMSLKRRQWELLFDQEMPGPWTYVGAVFSSENMYWFLWALIAFNIFLWATRRLPRWAALALTLTPLLILPLNQEFTAVAQAIMFLPVFMVGVHFSLAIRQFATEPVAPVKVVASVALYIAGFGAYAVWRLVADFGLDPVAWPLWPGAFVRPDEMWIVVRAVGQMLMLPAAVLGALALSKIPFVSGFLQFVGRHTLPIYLGHPIALTLVFTPMFLATDGMEIGTGGGEFATRTGVWLAVGMVAAAVGSFALWALARVPVIGWSLKPPAIEPLRQRILARAHRHHSAREDSAGTQRIGQSTGRREHD